MIHYDQKSLTTATFIDCIYLFIYLLHAYLKNPCIGYSGFLTMNVTQPRLDSRHKILYYVLNLYAPLQSANTVNQNKNRSVLKHNVLAQ